MNKSTPTAGPLEYQSPPSSPPIPAWKHVVFAPLLCFVAMFIAAAIFGLGIILLAALKSW